MTAIDNFDNSPSLPTQLDRIAQDGYVTLTEVCDHALVERILDVAVAIARDVRNALGDREVGIGSAAGFVEIVQRSPGRWDVPISPREFGVHERQMPWWPLIVGTLGDDAEHSFSGVVSAEPGSPAQQWHIDSPHESAEHLEPHAMNVLIALHDISMTMGPTECARGSHFHTNHLCNPQLDPDALVYQHSRTSPGMLVQNSDAKCPEGHAQPMRAGSCLVFDDRLLHRGLANESDRTRHVAYFSYRKKGYAKNTHFESGRSVFDMDA